ncbi:MAG TPA: hypothetical protein VLY20_00360 [Nitrospiria bacterium]|nr:hypothetical protein [Nitrospiria bacterium]
MSRKETIGRKRNFLCWIAALFAVSACATPSDATPTAESNAVNANGKKLGKLEPGTYVPRSLVFTSDGLHAVWLNRSNDQFQLLLDGTPAPPFDGIYRPPVVLSPDGRRMAYLVENKTDHYLSVVSDGKAGPGFDLILSGTPLFSSDGRHIAYAGAVRKKYRVFLDGAPSEEYELVGHLRFSPDGRHFAYAAQKDQKRFMVVDGAPGPSFDDVYPSGFSPDSRHLVYYATRGEKHRIMVDDHPGPEYDTIGPVRFNPVRGAEPPSITYIGLLGNDLIEVTQALP